MEPDGLGGLLGAVIGAIGGLAEPGATDVRINAEAPAHIRPLRFAAQGRLIDIHPSQIHDLSYGPDYTGSPALTVSFGPEVAEWIATTTEISVGFRMPVFICAKELMSPIVREPILGGSMVLNGDFDRDEMLAAMQIIAGRVDCEGQPVPGAEDPPPAARRKGGRP